MHLQQIRQHTPHLIGQPEILHLIAYRGSVGVPLMQLAQQVLRGAGNLSWGERELIFALTSRRNACQFCYTSHKAVAERYLGEQRVFEATYQPAGLDLAYFHLIEANYRPDFGDEDVRRRAVAYALSYMTEDTIHTALTVIALAHFFNRWVMSHGVADLSEEQAKASGERLYLHGYTQPTD